MGRSASDMDAARIALGVGALELLRAAEVKRGQAASEEYMAGLDQLQQAALVAQSASWEPGHGGGSTRRHERETQLGTMPKSPRKQALDTAVGAYEAAHIAALNVNPTQTEPAQPDAKYQAMRAGLTDMLGGGFLCYSCSIHRVHDAVERSRWLVTDGATGEPGLDILVREWGPYPPYGSWPADDEEHADDE